MNSIRNLKCSHKHKVTTFSQLNKEANGDNVTQTIFIWETINVAKLTKSQQQQNTTDTQSFFEVQRK